MSVDLANVHLPASLAPSHRLHLKSACKKRDAALMAHLDFQQPTDSPFSTLSTSSLLNTISVAVQSTALPTSTTSFLVSTATSSPSTTSTTSTSSSTDDDNFPFSLAIVAYTCLFVFAAIVAGSFGCCAYRIHQADVHARQLAAEGDEEAGILGEVGKEEEREKRTRRRARKAAVRLAQQRQEEHDDSDVVSDEQANELLQPKGRFGRRRTETSEEEEEDRRVLDEELRREEMAMQARRERRKRGRRRPV